MAGRASSDQSNRPSLKIEWFHNFTSQNCVSLTTTEAIARRTGRTRGQLAAKGQTREQADWLIAATAGAHHLTVATRNVKNFEGTGVEVFKFFDAK